jgi:hypothetical protein
VAEIMARLMMSKLMATAETAVAPTEAAAATETAVPPAEAGVTASKTAVAAPEAGVATTKAAAAAATAKSVGISRAGCEGGNSKRGSRCKRENEFA